MCKLGRFNLSELNEEGSVNSMVSKIVIHNGYSPQFHVADIAIVVMLDSIEFSNTIQPVCLPQLSGDVDLGTGTVVGWKNSERSVYKSFFQTPSKAKIKAVNGYDCLLKFPAMANAGNYSFCGGVDNNWKAPCLSDSGGAFYLERLSNSAWTVNGIASESLTDHENGCDINKFQLYTDVAKFHNWITRNMKETQKMTAKLIIPSPKPLVPSRIKRSFSEILQINHETLEIYWNNNFISGNLFRNYKGLKKLSFFRFPSNSSLGIVFENLTKLEELNLHDLVSETLERSLLTHLPTKLKQLTFDYSKIRFVSEDALQDLTLLETLSFFQCKIKKLHQKTFWNLTKLKKLYLSFTVLESFPSQIFRDLTDLEFLDLSFSKNEVYHENLFENLRNLKHLAIHFNPIKRIREKTFHSLVNLKIINLTACKLETLPSGLFEKNLNLEVIMLGSNLLTVIEVDFTALTTLKTLYLHHNSCIDENVIDNKNYSSVQEIQNKIRINCARS